MNPLDERNLGGEVLKKANVLSKMQPLDQPESSSPTVKGCRP